MSDKHLHLPVVPLNEKERFQRLYDSYVSNFNAYTTNVLGTFGYLLITTGWFVGSKDTRAFLAGSALVRYVAGGTVVVILIIHMIVSIGFSHRSIRKYRVISRYSDIEPLPIEDYRISVVLLVLNLLLNIAMNIVLLVILFS